MTDFRSYVKTLLNEKNEEEEKKAKKAKEYDDEEDIDDEEDEDDEIEASCRTGRHCIDNGCEPSVEDEDDDDDYDDDEDEDEDDDDAPKGKSLKESILYTSRYTNGTLTEEDLGIDCYDTYNSEVISESIKNNSASKFMKKLANKAEKEETKWIKKGEKENARVAKETAKKLKEASYELYRLESDYKSGEPEAKKKYKKLCAKYSNELKKMGKGGRVAKGILGVILAAASLTGVAAVTGFANDDIAHRIVDGASNGNLWDTIKSLHMQNKEAIKNLIKGLDDGKEGVVDAAKDVLGNKKYSDGYHDLEDRWNDGKKLFGKL